ncbi:MAG: phospholipid-binding protein MlaC [Gammaproteobacteria bacterium]
MLSRRACLARAFLVLLLTLPSSVVLAAPAPSEAVLEAITALRGQLEGLRGDGAEPSQPQVVDTVREVVLPRVDVEMAARLVLGRHWRDATDAQRQAFIDAERDLLLRLYAAHALDYLDAEVEVVATQVAPDGQRSGVRTRVSRPGKPEVSVDYQLRLANDEWKVFDAVVNGVSAIITLRNAIGEDISRFGLDGTITRLREKLSEVQTPAS